MIAVWPVLALMSAPPPGPPAVIDPKDFSEYWSAARVHLSGGNPYDAGQLLPLQRIASGHPDQPEATMLWTPPWTLPLYWPFGAAPVREGHAAWLVAQAGMIAAGVVMLWAAYRGKVTPAGVAVSLLLAVGFAPVWWEIGFGQNTGYLVLGLAGFVFFQSRGRPKSAGAFAALTAVKPHVLAVFGLALILHGLTRRGRTTLAAGVAAVAVLSALALIPDPRVFGEFLDTVIGPPTPRMTPVAHWQVPTLGYRLRVLVAAPGQLGDDRDALFWVQWVPLAVGCVALVPYWWRRRAAWDWTVETPRLVFASVLLAPYGTWLFDLTVLLVPVIQAAAWLAAAGRVTWSVAAAAAFLTTLFATFDPRLVRALHDTVWFAPVILALYLAVGGACRFRTSPDR